MSKTVNILFLGGAKRVEVARIFKRAGAESGCAVNLFSYELSPEVPIAVEATVLQGTKWGDDGILPHLHDLVVKHCIDIMVPFVDGAVEVAARYAAVYGDVFVPAGDAGASALMFDKVRAAKAFEDAGLPIPATYRPGDPCLRLIAKPRHGSASQGIIEINSLETLEAIMMRGADYLIQERIDNREEITVDCYVSVAGGELVAASPRVRIATVGGEVSETLTVDLPEAVELSAEVIRAMNLRGAVTVQLIRDRENPGHLMVMEVNPRLGGGVVCSIAAGADIPRLILQEYRGEPLKPLKPKAGVRVCRYLSSVIFDPDNQRPDTFR